MLVLAGDIIFVAHGRRSHARVEFLAFTPLPQYHLSPDGMSIFSISRAFIPLICSVLWYMYLQFQAYGLFDEYIL